MTPKPRRPRADVVARRFKRGESVAQIAAKCLVSGCRAHPGWDAWEVEDSLRRRMNRGRRA